VSIAILINHVLDPNPLRARALLAMTWLQVIVALISVVLIFVQCSPVEMLWNPAVQGTCWNPNVFNSYNYFVSAYTTLTDIVLAVVPVSVLWKLQMPTSTKVGVCIMSKCIRDIIYFSTMSTPSRTRLPIMNVFVHTYKLSSLTIACSGLNTPQCHCDNREGLLSASLHRPDRSL
jgi:hypothetical protein